MHKKKKKKKKGRKHQGKKKTIASRFASQVHKSDLHTFAYSYLSGWCRVIEMKDVHKTGGSLEQ